MTAHEVLCRQRSTDPLFKTAGAQATAHQLHARSFPNLRLDGVDLRPFIDGLVDDLIVPVEGECLLQLLTISEYPARGSLCRAIASSD